MGKVIDFTVGRFKKNVKQPTIQELVKDAVDFLLADWEKMAKSNKLNAYFKTSLPNSISTDSKINYMSDLNEIAHLELNLDLYPMIFFPGTQQRSQLGWIVQVKLGDETIATPELATEAYARCFNILLFLKVKQKATQVGLLN